MKISDQEKRRRICNIIRDGVMTEIDKLRSEPENRGMVQAVESASALDRLISTVSIKNNRRDEKISHTNPVSLDERIIASNPTNLQL